MQCRYINLDQIALAEHGLVHPRDLELEYYVAFLSRRSEYTDVLQAHYVNTRTNYATIHPINQKLQLSSCFRNQLADHATFMLGNWSAPNSRFHEPMRCVDFRRSLQKNDFFILLIGEFRANKCCPHCEEMALETFRMVPNLHCYRRQALPQVIIHSLSRCTYHN